MLRTCPEDILPQYSIYSKHNTWETENLYEHIGFPTQQLSLRTLNVS